MPQTVVIIGEIILACAATIWGLLSGLVTQDMCTGTNSLGNNFSKVCSEDFPSYVWLFTIASVLLMLVLIALSSWQSIRRGIRYALQGILIIYAIWLIGFSSSIWVTPFFTDRHYPDGVNPKCLECAPSIMPP